MLDLILYIDDILYALNKWKSRESMPDEVHKKVSSLQSMLQQYVIV